MAKTVDDIGEGKTAVTEQFFYQLGQMYPADEWNGEEKQVRALIFKLEQTLSDRYAIIAPLGVGGIGIVLKVRDSNLSAFRALKFARPTIGHEIVFAEVITEEISHLLQAIHPNITQIYYKGNLRLKGQKLAFPYYVMDYIDGATDALKFFDSCRRSQEDIIRILRQVLLGLQHLHKMGILHCDVKLENVLVSGDGQKAVISDLGSARDMNKTLSPISLIYSDAWAHPGLKRLRPLVSTSPLRRRTVPIAREKFQT